MNTLTRWYQWCRCYPAFYFWCTDKTFAGFCCNKPSKVVNVDDFILTHFHYDVLIMKRFWQNLPFEMGNHGSSAGSSHKVPVIRGCFFCRCWWFDMPWRFVWYGPVLCKHVVWRHRKMLKLLKHTLAYSRNKNLFDNTGEGARKLPSYLLLISVDFM